MEIRDSTGTREILAIKVLTHAIKYFRKLMLNTINRKRLDVKETKIRWVLTFPAIWPDRVKQLMIEAAELVCNLLHGLLIMKLNEFNFNSFFFK